MMRRGSRGVCGAAARRSAQSLCAPSRLAALRSRPGQTSRPAATDNPNNALIFNCYYYYYFLPPDVSPVGVLMDGVAWTPSVTRWRWILAFVSWGISRFRFCPRCSGRRARRCGSTAGKRRVRTCFFLDLHLLCCSFSPPLSPCLLVSFMVHLFFFFFFYNSVILCVFQLLWCKCGGHRQQDRASHGEF